MMLVIRILNEFSEALGILQMTNLEQQYRGYYNALVAKVRGNPNWYDTFGIHACTEAINANFTTPSEQTAIYERVILFNWFLMLPLISISL
jgi:hypothetical protein